MVTRLLQSMNTYIDDNHYDNDSHVSRRDNHNERDSHVSRRDNHKQHNDSDTQDNKDNLKKIKMEQQFNSSSSDDEDNDRRRKSPCKSYVTELSTKST